MHWLKRFAIFIGVGVFHDAKVAVVARLADVVLLYSIAHGTTWLMSVGAIVVLTFL